MQIFVFMIIFLLIADIFVYARLIKKYKENKKLEKRINELTFEDKKLFKYFFGD